MARILVIDDEYEIRVFLRKALEHAGHEVVDASDSEDGLRVFREQPADLVITDLFMPPKGGFEVIQELKKDGADVKIVAISGSATDFLGNNLARARQLGAAAVLEKPFSPQKIVETVQKLLGE